MSDRKVCIVLVLFLVFCAVAFAGYYFREPLTKFYRERIQGGNTTTTLAPTTTPGPTTTTERLETRTSPRPSTKVQSLLAHRSPAEQPAKLLRKRSPRIPVN